MEAITRWFKAVFGVMFKSRIYQYRQRARAKISAETVGRVQDKIQGSIRKADSKVNSAMDGKKKDKDKDKNASPKKKKD